MTSTRTSDSIWASSFYSRLRSAFIFLILIRHTLQQHQRRGGAGSPLSPESTSLLNLEITCGGILPEPQCQCSETNVVCVNAQLRSAETLILIDAFPKLRQLTFHGNNFGQLPERALSNSSRLNQLVSLNLSANYLVSFHPRAFAGLSGVEKLDLSENEIILDQSMTQLFLAFPKLKDLYLRRAFRRAVNRFMDSSVTSLQEKQMELLEKLFRDSKLYELERLDLSLNGFTLIRPTLFCPIDKLTHVFLSWNHLRRLELDLNCIRRLKVLDLRDNHFVALDSAFYQLAARLPINAVKLHDNPFECSCNSSFYMSWLARTDKVIDKGNLTCEKAWPRAYAKKLLVLVPPEKLECPPKNLANAGPGDKRPKGRDWTRLTVSAGVTFLLFCSKFSL